MMNTQNFVLNGLLVESLLSFTPEQLSVLEQALQLAQERLRSFVNDPAFASKMALAFGSGSNADALQAAWLAGDFSVLSGIEILGADEINWANGAYAVSTDRIYLSLGFLERHLSDPEGLVSVLLEEAGHRIDAQLNEKDSPGDEGAIFSALVQGETLSESQLGVLKAEDDTATVQLNGQVVQIEQASPGSNPFYKYDVIAQANTLLGTESIEKGVSINDNGKVAFVADLSALDFSDSLYVGNGSSAPTKFSSGSGSLQPGVQINNQDQVIGSLSFLFGSSNVSLWDASDLTKSGIGGIVVTASGGSNVFPPTVPLNQRFTFEQIFGYPSLSNSVSIPSNNYSGIVFRGSTKNAFGSLNPVLAVPILGAGHFTTPIDNPAYPVVTDQQNVLVRLGNRDQTNNTGPASPIVLYNSSLSRLTPIANVSMGFKALGQKPGVSDNGQIVVFYGDLADADLPSTPINELQKLQELNDKQQRLRNTNGSQLFLDPLTSGSGIFASIAVQGVYSDTNGNNQQDVGEASVDRVIVRISGKADGFDNFDPNSRIAVNSTHRDEDLNKNGIFDTGEDLNNNGKYDPSQRAVTVVYKAFDKAGQDVISSNRLNFFGTGSSDFNPDIPGEFNVSTPTLVVKDGQTINGLSGVVDEIDINDAVNNRDRGDVAFWVKTTTGDVAVVRARPKEVIFLDFDPVKNFKVGLDSGAAIFTDLGIPLSWSGNIDNVFSTLAPSRPDLNGSTNIETIQNAIVAAVQQAFDNVDANVEILGRSGDLIPTDGRFTHIYIGDSPYDSSKNIRPINGQAASVDLFNQDLFTGDEKLKGKSIFNQDAAVIFVDNIFSIADYNKTLPGLEGYFTDGSGNLVNLNQTGTDQIDVITAISNIITHEIGHTLGLMHLKNDLNTLVMNSNKDYFSNELRSVQNFGLIDNKLQPIFDKNGNPIALNTQQSVQNDQQRLAFTVGSDLNVSRIAPSTEILAVKNRSKFSLGSVIGGSSIKVAKAALGIVPLGDDDTIPQFIDLGSGDLATLLNQEIEVATQDRIILIASTDGKGIDIFGAANGFQGNVDDIDLTNGLFVLSDDRIRGRLFDDSGQPLASSLDLFQATPTGINKIGSVGVANIVSNSPPTAVDNSTITNEDTPVNINILANASDPDGDPLILSLATLPNNGTALVNDNNTPLILSDDYITYTPTLNFNGTDSFTYTVSDGKGGSANATVTVTVDPINDPPTLQLAIPDQTASANTAFSFTFAANTFIDVDTNDTLSYLVTLDDGSNLPTWLNFDPATQTLSGTPQNTNVGLLNLKVTATDQAGATATDIFTLTVGGLNHPPTGTATAVLPSGTEDTAYTINTADLLVGFTDIDNNPLIVTNLTVNNGTLSNNGNGTYTFTPNPNYNGTVSLTYTVDDGNGGSVAATQSFTLIAVNDAPTGTASAALATGTEDTAYTINSADLLQGFTDPDGDPLSVSGLTAANGSIFDNGNGNYTFTPNPNYNGTINLTYNVTDSNGGSIPATQSFSLTAVNDAPTGSPTAALLTGAEDTPYTLNTSALLQSFSDIDGDALSVANLTATNGSLVNNNNGTYTFNPSINYNGPVTLNYDVIDGNGGSISATQSFSLSAVNDAPTGSPTAILASGAEDTPYTINSLDLLTGFSDVDGDPLSVTNLTATNGTLVNNNNGTYIFTPTANFNGTVNLNYNVIDSNSGSIAAAQSFSLAAVNDAPTLNNISKTGTINTVISFTATDFTSVFSDIDSDSLTKIQITSLPTNGTLNLNGVPVSLNQEIAATALGTLTFTPTANYNGPTSFDWNGFDGTTYAVTGAAVNLTINSGSNSIQGTPGPDTLVGTDLVDTIDGKAGNDIITGKKGDDILTGGGNRDTFIFNLGDGTDTITDFGGVGTGNYPTPAIIAQVDTLQFQGAGLTARNLLLTQNGSNLEITFEGITGNKVILQNFDLQNLDNLSKERAKVIGNILFDGQTSVTDSYDVFDANSTQTNLSHRNTVTFLNDLNNTVNGFDKSDDVINGQGGNDTIYGKGGNDLLRGGAGDDKLFGGAGNDILRGGTGNDILSGGNGNDLFVLASGDGTDTITDFNRTADKIGLANGLSFGQLTITQGTGNNVRNTFITDSSNNELLAILNGVQANTLTSGMFIAV